MVPVPVERKLIQFSVESNGDEASTIWCLFDDGTLWYYDQNGDWMLILDPSMMPNQTIQEFVESQ